MTKYVLVVAVVAILGGCTQNEGSGDDDAKDTGTPAVDSRVTEPDSNVSSSLQPVYASGPRLKRRIITGSDGSKDFAGWYDSQLGVNCAWGVAEDGKQRCLPGDSNTPLYFQDAACRLPLAVDPFGNGTGGGTPAPCYVGSVHYQLAQLNVPGQTMCRFTGQAPVGGFAVLKYTVTPAVFTGTARYRRNGAACEMLVVPPPVNGPVFEAEIVPAAMLVEATETRE